MGHNEYMKNNTDLNQIPGIKEICKFAKPFYIIDFDLFYLILR